MTDTALANAISVIVDTIITPDPTPETPATPGFWADRTNVRFNPKRGFEQILANVLFGDRILTSTEIVNELLSSGEYHRVAPQAATLRPHRPVNFLLKTWVAAGYVKQTA